MIKFKSLRLALNVFWVVLSISACQNTGDGADSNENPIRLKGEIMASSRVTNLNLQSTRFVEGQLVGVTIADAQSTHDNVAWMADVNGYLVNMGADVSWGIDEITVYAYHPYKAGMSTNSLFSVQTDQSTDEGYLKSDLLWAKKTAVKTDALVTLSFAHKLTKLNVKLESDDIDDLSGATISICGTDIATLFNSQTGELSASVEKNIKDIKASVTTSAAFQASCIIVPQTLSDGTTFIRVEHAGVTYEYKLPASFTFYEGRVYTFTITINKNNPGDVGAMVPDMPWG